MKVCFVLDFLLVHIHLDICDTTTGKLKGLFLFVIRSLLGHKFVSKTCIQEVWSDSALKNSRHVMCTVLLCGGQRGKTCSEGFVNFFRGTESVLFSLLLPFQDSIFTVVVVFLLALLWFCYLFALVLNCF